VSLSRAEIGVDLKSAIRELAQELKRRLAQDRQSNDARPTVVRVERVVSDISPLQAILRAKAERKVYWRERDGSIECAGIGVADLVTVDGISDAARAFEVMRARLQSLGATARYFGGFRFDKFAGAKPISPEWNSLGSGLFVLPLVEIRRRKDTTILAIQIVTGSTSALDTIDQFQFDSDSGSDAIGGLPAIRDCRELPNRDEWNRHAARALRAISADEIRKVVLARRVSYDCINPFNPFRLLERAFAASDSATIFGIQQKCGSGFIGGTPELLFSRSGDCVESEAIAGTRRMATEDHTDSHSSAEFRQSHKDRREVDLVRDAITDRLARYCMSIESPHDPEICRAGNVQHLRYPVGGILKTGVSDAELLAVLSPTPAVCGTPSEKAIALIRESEGFDRGWYAGPVGWISKDAAQFAVAIRSALVNGNTVHLYSGAGIVDGSEASSEWEELDAKIATLKAALGA
jgi:menaquinone-specific isochorismate synthase